jgi:hypothetical protein
MFNRSGSASRSLDNAAGAAFKPGQGMGGGGAGGRDEPGKGGSMNSMKNNGSFSPGRMSLEERLREMAATTRLQNALAHEKFMKYDIKEQIIKGFVDAAMKGVTEPLTKMLSNAVKPGAAATKYHCVCVDAKQCTEGQEHVQFRCTDDEEAIKSMRGACQGATGTQGGYGVMPCGGDAPAPAGGGGGGGGGGAADSGAAKPSGGAGNGHVSEAAKQGEEEKGTNKRLYNQKMAEAKRQKQQCKSALAAGTAGAAKISSDKMSKCKAASATTGGAAKNLSSVHGAHKKIAEAMSGEVDKKQKKTDEIMAAMKETSDGGTTAFLYSPADTLNGGGRSSALFNILLGGGRAYAAATGYSGGITDAELSAAAKVCSGNSSSDCVAYNSILKGGNDSNNSYPLALKPGGVAERKAFIGAYNAKVRDAYSRDKQVFGKVKQALSRIKERSEEGKRIADDAGSTAESLESVFSNDASPEEAQSAFDKLDQLEGKLGDPEQYEAGGGGDVASLPGGGDMRAGVGSDTSYGIAIQVAGKKADQDEESKVWKKARPSWAVEPDGGKPEDYNLESDKATLLRIYAIDRNFEDEENRLDSFVKYNNAVTSNLNSTIALQNKSDFQSLVHKLAANGNGSN